MYTIQLILGISIKKKKRDKMVQYCGKQFQLLM